MAVGPAGRLASAVTRSRSVIVTAGRSAGPACAEERHDRLGQHAQEAGVTPHDVHSGALARPLAYAYFVVRSGSGRRAFAPDFPGDGFRRAARVAKLQRTQRPSVARRSEHTARGARYEAREEPFADPGSRAEASGRLTLALDPTRAFPDGARSVFLERDHLHVGAERPDAGVRSTTVVDALSDECALVSVGGPEAGRNAVSPRWPPPRVGAPWKGCVDPHVHGRPGVMPRVDGRRIHEGGVEGEGGAATPHRADEKHAADCGDRADQRAATKRGTIHIQ